MKASDRLAIGQLAKRTGLAVSAIRYYEEQGLVTAFRNKGGHRRFARSDIRRLSFVLIAQQFGFTIARIRQQLDSIPNAKTLARMTGPGSVPTFGPSSTHGLRP